MTTHPRQITWAKQEDDWGKFRRQSFRIYQPSGRRPCSVSPMVQVHGEVVGPFHLDHPAGEPAPALVWKPYTGVLPTLLEAVHLRRGEGEVSEVLGKPGPGHSVRRTEPRVMCLARRHNVFDVRLGRGGETPTRAGPVYRAKLARDVLLDWLWVGVFSFLVARRASVPGRHCEAVPSHRGRGPGKGECAENDEQAKTRGHAALPPRVTGALSAAAIRSRRGISPTGSVFGGYASAGTQGASGVPPQ